MSDVRPSIPDPEGLAARLAVQDPEALGEAYRLVFTGEIGRFVLAHILADAGVGQPRGPEMGARERMYQDGRQDQALQIMNRAGFEQRSAVVAVLDESNQLKGRDDERAAEFGRPDEHPGEFLPG